MIHLGRQQVPQTTATRTFAAYEGLRGDVEKHFRCGDLAGMPSPVAGFLVDPGIGGPGGVLHRKHQLVFVHRIRFFLDLVGDAQVLRTFGRGATQDDAGKAQFAQREF